MNNTTCPFCGGRLIFIQKFITIAQPLNPPEYPYTLHEDLCCEKCSSVIVTIKDITVEEKKKLGF